MPPQVIDRRLRIRNAEKLGAAGRTRPLIVETVNESSAGDAMLMPDNENITAASASRFSEVVEMSLPSIFAIPPG